MFYADQRTFTLFKCSVFLSFPFWRVEKKRIYKNKVYRHVNPRESRTHWFLVTFSWTVWPVLHIKCIHPQGCFTCFMLLQINKHQQNWLFSHTNNVQSEAFNVKVNTWINGWNIVNLSLSDYAAPVQDEFIFYTLLGG